MLPCASECEFASRGNLSPAPGRWIASRQDDRHRRGGTRLRGSKKIKGRKRQLLVDTQALVLEARVHSAKIQDWAGIEKLVPSGRRARFSGALPRLVSEARRYPRPRAADRPSPHSIGALRGPEP